MKFKHLQLFMLSLTCLAAGWSSPNAMAQGAYPTKPVKIIVPYSAGGGNDTLARLFAQALNEKWGTTVFVENRAGGSGNIGATAAVRSAPDGYTLLIMPSDLSINPGLFRTMPYDAVKDLAPIVALASAPVMIAVRPESDIASFQDLVTKAKAKPHTLDFGSCGAGTPAHLAAEMLKSAASIDMVHIPYKGCSPAQLDAVGGHVSVVFSTVANVVPFIKGDKLRGLAVTSLVRSPLAPNVPTVAESGFPGFEIDSWFGLLAPAKTPPAIINKINADVRDILANPAFKDRLTSEGFQTIAGSPAEFRDLIVKDMTRFKALITKIGAQVD